MDETKTGKGAIIDTPDERDYVFTGVAGGLEPFDWNKGYDIEEVIGKKLDIKDQDGSYSCGGQAWAYYGQVLDPEHVQKSAKFIYSQTFVGSGGSAGRTNSDLVCSKGWGDEDLTTSYENGLPPSEIFMERPQDITPEAFSRALLDRALKYGHANLNIDDIAVAIRENKGCILGVYGKNNGTWLSPFPVPPDTLSQCWAHWTYCGKAKLINGKKYIGFANSWGKSVGEEGWQWYGEEYFQANGFFSSWTIGYNNIVPPVIPVTYKTIRRGSRGVDVKELQTILNRKVGCNLSVDGIFGEMTLRQVLNFQTINNLVVDGIVGPKTWAVLNK